MAFQMSLFHHHEQQNDHKSSLHYIIMFKVLAQGVQRIPAQQRAGIGIGSKAALWPASACCSGIHICTIHNYPQNQMIALLASGTLGRTVGHETAVCDLCLGPLRRVAHDVSDGAPPLC